MHGFGPRASSELHARPLASRAARDAAAAHRVHGAILTRAHRRRACAQVLSRAPTRAFRWRWKALTSCRDAPVEVASSPATGSTRRAPSARSRARAPVRPVHPSAEPRPSRGTFLLVTSLGERHPDPSPATRRAAAWQIVEHLVCMSFLNVVVI
jgi:hypothetical protein